MTQKHTPVENSNTFVCDCDTSKEMAFDEVKDHLLSVHGIKDLTGTKQMMMHLNGVGFHSYTWLWQFGDRKVTQYVTRKKDKN